MADVESRARGSNVNNPYKGESSVLPRWHPINVLRKTFWMGASFYGLHYFDAYSTIMKSPKVSHEWFKIGIAASIALLFVKAYVEIYAGKLKKEEVSYKNFPGSTKSSILLILLSSLAYHVALWPAYGSTSMIVMLLVGAFLLNFSLLFPTYVQNIVAFLVMTFFLQEYK